MFDSRYQEWLTDQIANCSGERRRRLEQHGHAEKMFIEQIWWECFGHFEHLFGEFEVVDYKDGIRFLDYAYLRRPIKIGFEIDGFGPHSRDADRKQFADHLMRQNHLILDDWIIIRFSYDDVKERPRQCIQLIQHVMGKFFGKGTEQSLDISLYQREILRIFSVSPTPLSPTTIGINPWYQCSICQKVNARSTRQTVSVYCFNRSQNQVLSNWQKALA